MIPYWQLVLCITVLMPFYERVIDIESINKALITVGFDEYSTLELVDFRK